MRLLILAVTVLGLVVARPAAAQDLARHFQGTTGTFVLLDGRPARSRAGTARATTLRAVLDVQDPEHGDPAETGAAPDPEFVVKYDPA
jgi:hypothetical protein